MKNILLLCLFFWGLLTDGSSARAACNGLTLNSLAVATYDFASGTAPSLILTVAKANGSCNYFLTVGYGGAADFSGRRIAQGAYTIPMNIYKDVAHTQIVKDIPAATADTDVIVGNISGGASTSDSTYYPQLGTAPTYNKFGNHTDSFVIKLYEGSITAAHTVKNLQTVTFNYFMPRVVDLSLVNTGGTFNIADTTQSMSFGNLVAGASQSFDIVLKYNAGYNVKLSSNNNGNLKHAALSDTVPYAITVNSVPVNLAGSSTTPVSVASGAGVSSSTGLVLPSTVTIGALGTARSGTNYTDVITFTVISTE